MSEIIGYQFKDYNVQIIDGKRYVFDKSYRLLSINCEDFDLQITSTELKGENNEML